MYKINKNQKFIFLKKLAMIVALLYIPTIAANVYDALKNLFNSQNNSYFVEKDYTDTELAQPNQNILPEANKTNKKIPAKIIRSEINLHLNYLANKTNLQIQSTESNLSLSQQKQKFLIFYQKNLKSDLPS